MRDEDQNSLNSFFKNAKTDNQEQQSKSRKICLLLIEDVDIVFDQDEGFTTALSQLLTMSKRPVILTTADDTALHVQKFVNSHHVIRFRELKSAKINIWLQLVCLLEGIYIEKENLGELLDYFKGDVRKTLLQLQFLVETYDNKQKNRIELIDDQELDDVKIDVLKDCHQDISVKNCIIVDEKTSLPENVRLETLWWNIPVVLNKTVANDDRKKLKSACEILDTFAYADSLYNKMNLDEDLVPVLNYANTYVKDSLELQQKQCLYSENCDLAQKVGHTVLGKCINVYGNKEEKLHINMGLPSFQDKR